MGIWTDIAEWRGPTINRVTNGMVEWRGLVVHIAEGSYEGTISWQKNPASSVSSHFVVDTDGKLAQVVDTADTAWTQIAGNGHWLSVECAGFTPNPLTDAQLHTIARLLAKCHAVYGVPLQLAINPDGRGLGHHSMGTNGGSVPTDNWTGPTWGHTDCPGPNIIAQKPTILALAGGATTGGKDQDMPHFLYDPHGTSQYMADSNFERVWAFNSNDVFQKVYAAAGKPPSQPVDPADITACLYGEYVGIYTVPRQAPAAGGDGSGPAAPPAKYTVSLSGTLSGSMSGSATPVPPASGQ